MTLESLLQQAVTRHRAGDLPAAEALYLRLLQAAPHAFAPRHLLGVLRGQQGRLPEAIALIEQALAAHPDVPDAQYNYGKLLKDAGRLPQALAALDQAQALGHPGAQGQRAEVLNRLCVAALEAGEAAQALALADRALADAPDYANAHDNRAVALSRLGRVEDSLAAFRAALALQPDYAPAHYNHANALRDALKLDEAMAAFDRAIALNPGFGDAYRNKGLLSLLRGDFATGLPLYEWRKKANPPVEARDYAQPLWTGAQDIAGKTVFAYVEQGLGDALQFYRFVAPLLERGARVVLGVPRALLPLLGRGRWPVTLIANPDAPPDFDFHVPLTSLPLALGMTMATIPGDTPYLSAEPQLVAHWKDRIGKKGFKIGISWQGADAGRAVPLAAFAPLASLPAVRLISLQKGLGTEQLAALPAVESLGADFDAGPGAFLDSAAVMESLDLVVTLDSSVAHLAGALARPCWVALRRVPDWRWFLARTDSPWYPGMRLFRQERDGDWAGVFDDMRRRLEEMS